MALRLNVSRPTLRQGMKLLEDKGLLVADSSGGTGSRAPRNQYPPIHWSISSRPAARWSTTIWSCAARSKAWPPPWRRHGRTMSTGRRSNASAWTGSTPPTSTADPHDEADADVDLHIADLRSQPQHRAPPDHACALGHAAQRACSTIGRSSTLARRFGRCCSEQHRAIYDAVMSRDAGAAGRAAEEHMTYTRRVLAEIAAAEARLEISLRRLDGGKHQFTCPAGARGSANVEVGNPMSQGGRRAERAAVPGDDLGGRPRGAQDKGEAGCRGEKADGAAAGEVLSRHGRAPRWRATWWALAAEDVGGGDRVEADDLASVLGGEGGGPRAASAKGTASLPPMPPSAVLPMTKEAAFASVQLSAPGSAQVGPRPCRRRRSRRCPSAPPGAG